MTAPSRDLRTFAAVTYIKGILGLDPEHVANVPRIIPGATDNRIFAFVWAQRLARPATSWAWSQAIIEKVSAEGNKITVRVSLPDVEKLVDNPTFLAFPRTVREWFTMDSLMKQRDLNFIDRKTVYRELQINYRGQLDLTFPQVNAFLNKPIDEMRDGIKWFLTTDRVMPHDYIEEAWGEVSSSTVVVLPKDVMLGWAKLIKRSRFIQKNP